jgi:hypothetical protein
MTSTYGRVDLSSLACRSPSEVRVKSAGLPWARSFLWLAAGRWSSHIGRHP